MARKNLLALEVHAPQAGQGEEEAVGHHVGERVRHRGWPALFHGHAGRKRADFQRVGSGELVDGRDGHGLDHGVLQRLGERVEGRRRGGFCFGRSEEPVEFAGELLGGEGIGGGCVCAGQGGVFFGETGEFAGSEAESG